VFTQERIPLLSATLKRCRGRIGLIVELKYYGWDEKLVPLVVESVEKADMVPHVRIMSLQPDGIRQVRELRPEWPVGLLSAAALGDLTRMGADFLAVHSRMATPEFVQRVQAAGQALHVWTVNDGAGMMQFLGLGVDGIITDEPVLAERLRGQYRRLKPIHRLMVHTGLLVAEDAAHVDPATDAPPRGVTR
jgi:glycerophosphoryl diester phosphodiesterase